MAATVIDARGRELSLQAPRRVVSLVPSLTETLIELDLGDRLAGRTRYCIHPAPEVSRISAFGGTKNPKVEAIIETAPDLVLACVEENKPEHLEALEAAGLKVHAVHPRDLDDVAAFLSDYAAIFDAAERVNPLLEDLGRAREEAADFSRRLLAAREGRPPRSVTLIWKSPWMASGSDTYIHAVMTALGLDNAFAERETYFETSADELAAMDLDLVLLPDEPYPFGQKELEELVKARVASGADSMLLVKGELLSWYGSRSPRALRELIRILESRIVPSP